MDLRTARFISNMRQVDLYKATGIHPPRLSAIENDHVKPSVNEKKKIESALNCPIDWDWGDESRFKRQS